MINLPHPPKIVKKEGNKAIFEIEALHPGYGVTIGNSLRRVLLSSLEGAAVTQMKIKGISHEFSTIPGVLEDVITIMLNLKQLRFRLFVAEPQKAVLKVKGEKEVKGLDFILPAQVELANKNCHLATLTSKSAELEMEIQIEKGIGYSSRETRQKEKLEIGAIPVDAIFTPVKRVSYRIENMRVGERTDYDRVFLEIETDGIIAPEQALWQASEILVKHFSLLTEALAEVEKKESSSTRETLKPKTVSEIKPTGGKKPMAKKKAKQSKKISSSSSSSLSKMKAQYEKKKKRKKTK
jgi:DNA-directed RNA polymerase subunit alpha